MNYKKILTQDDQIRLVLVGSILFGAIVRFLPALQVGFPLNDGGMFLSMIRDLRTSHYELPLFTSYNKLNIPYAYPPFGFYFSRMLSDGFNISEVNILLWLPPLVNTVSILVFYRLASSILQSQWAAAVGTIFYSLTPGASIWFVMGGGLTRGFGSIFLMFSLLWVFRLFQGGGGRELIWSILFCSLTILSHPEAGIHVVVGVALLCLFYGLNYKDIQYAVLIFVFTFVGTSFWWGTVLAYHGLAPFLSAMNTGSVGESFWISFFVALIASQSFIPILPLVRFMGLIWGGAKKRYFLILWAFIPFLIEPRGAPSASFYPFCMLMALVFVEALPSLFNYMNEKKKLNTEAKYWQWMNLGLVVLMCYMFIEASLYGFRLVNSSLTWEDREAMTWIQDNTSDSSRILSITGVESPETDPFIEWLPALTGRQNETTIQGLEWTLGRNFYTRYDDLAHVQVCETENCITEWSARTGLGFDYLVIRKPGTKKNLINSLWNSPQYVNMYSTDGVVVFFVSRP